MTVRTLLEGDWDDAVAATDGPQLVVGGPGSGKTEFLIRRAVHLITRAGVAPDDLIVLSFSRRAAAAIRNRIAGALDHSATPIGVSTFHSLSMRLLEAHGPDGEWHQLPTLLTGPEHVALVGEVLESEDPAAWPLPFRGLLAEPSFADEVADFQLRAAERLATADTIAAAGRSDWRALPGFLERYRATLLARGRIDYGSLQAEAVTLLTNPDVRKQAGVSYVLVDDYQDTTVAQAALLERLGSAGNVTVTGDPYQSIFSFRGAELTNVAEFPDRFRDPSGDPARRIVLGRSFRVPHDILAAAVRVTHGAGLPGAAGPMEPAGPGGSVETYAFDQYANEAEWIASEIQRAHLRDRIPYSRMAVLVRSKRGVLPELSRALERRRIPHDRPDVRLVDHAAVRPILDLARAATAVNDKRAALQRVLLGPLVGLTLSAARDFARRAVQSDWGTALAGTDVPTEVTELITDTVWADGMPAADGFWAVWSRVKAFEDLVLDENREGDRRAIAAFSQALVRLGERDPTATLGDYAAMSETEDFEATPLLEFQGDDDRLTLTTLHQSKGRTFDVVFIADAREGTLPDLRSRDSLLGARHLSPSHGGDDTAYAAFRLQEEMRLAYSAMCRASRRVVWTCTATGFDGGEGMPSRFLPAVAGVPMAEAAARPADWATPTTPLEAEAWLRRMLADPEEPAIRRLAAAAVLATEAPWRPRSPAAFAGVRSAGPDLGLVDDAPLSASQADAYTRCPRRYAFERRLRIGSGGSKYQELGSVIHRALERAERAATERGEPRATAADAVAALDEEFEAELFDGGAWAEAWRNRADTIVARLYDLWPGDGIGVGHEVDFEVEVAGDRWRGRIDRVERRGDAAHIVDYKTGTSAPTIDDAARSLQLGLYVHGLRSTTEQPVGGAEFWYPAHAMRTAKSVTVRSLDLDRLTEVDEALSAAAAGIRAEEWAPIPSDECDRCPVRLVCPEWPEGREAFVE